MSLLDDTTPEEQAAQQKLLSDGVDPNAQIPQYWNQTGVSRKNAAFGQDISPYLQQALVSSNPFPSAVRIQPVMEGYGGLGVFNSGAVGELPLRAMMLNQMKPPPPSVNMKLALNFMEKYNHAPKTDPLLQKSLDSKFNKVVDDYVTPLVSEYGARAYEILSGLPRSQQELEIYNDFKKAMEHISESADVGKNLGDRVKKAQEDLAAGKRLSPEYVDALKTYHDEAYDKDSPIESSINRQTAAAQEIQQYDSFKSIASQYLPKDDILAKSWTRSTTMVPDKSGKMVPKEVLVTSINPETLVKNEGESDADFQKRVEANTITLPIDERAHQISEDLKAQGDDFGYKNDADREAYIKKMISYEIPHYDDIHEANAPSVTNVRVGDDASKAPLPFGSTTMQFNDPVTGLPKTQDIAYNTSIKPVNISLGKVDGSITEHASYSLPAEINDGKVVGMQIMNVAIREGGAVRVVGNGDALTGKHTIQVPYAIVQVPKERSSTSVKGKKATTTTSESQFVTHYIPLTEAMGDIINSAGKEDKDAIISTINNVFNKADELNVAATPEAKDYYQKHFKPTINTAPDASQGGFKY